MDSVGGDKPKKPVLEHDPWADSLEQVDKCLHIHITSAIINVGVILTKMHSISHPGIPQSQSAAAAARRRHPSALATDGEGV